MSARAKVLFDEALALPADEREALAASLLESLEGEAGDVDTAWLAELERRAREANEGTSGARDFDAALADIRADLQRG
ncbi:MAG: addiction module protein [Polyangiaceae bacterium]|jgi:putative addiction module component (TIGR02574 family)|nr:addiction module protein [Polyangiaceae bacterium]